MKLVPESLQESLNFERGMDPKTSMGIGDASGPSVMPQSFRL